MLPLNYYDFMIFFFAKTVKSYSHFKMNNKITELGDVCLLKNKKDLKVYLCNLL